MPNEKDIYDIENRLGTNNSNTLEGNDFERENYMSNRDVKIHKKIVPTTDSVVNIQKEITNRKKERDNERTKEEKEMIVFLLIMLNTKATLKATVKTASTTNSDFITGIYCNSQNSPMLYSDITKLYEKTAAIMVSINSTKLVIPSATRYFIVSSIYLAMDYRHTNH